MDQKESKTKFIIMESILILFLVPIANFSATLDSANRKIVIRLITIDIITTALTIYLVVEMYKLSKVYNSNHSTRKQAMTTIDLLVIIIVLSAIKLFFI